MFGRKKKGDAAAFWAWFEGEAPALAKAYDAFVAGDAGPEPLVHPVAKEMDRFHDGIAHEIGHDGRNYDFVISADGIRANVDAVKALANAAPTIDGWKVTAFRPRKPMDEDAVLQLGDEVFGDGNIFYRLGDASDGKCDVAIRFRSTLEAPDDALIGPAFLIMDAAIGEYDVMTKVGEIDVAFSKPDAPLDDFRPIKELAGDLDARFPETAH